MDEFWESANREAREFKDSYLALDRLIALYRSFGQVERKLADDVLAQWVLSGSEAKRFDALALIRNFGIASAVPALHTLAVKLEHSDDPGAPFEREKVMALLSELNGRRVPKP